MKGKCNCNLASPIPGRIMSIIHIISAAGITIGGVLVWLNVFAFHVTIIEGIVAFVRIISGPILMLSGIIWLVLTFYPNNLGLNGASLAFSIISLLAVITHDATTMIVLKYGNDCSPIFRDAVIEENVACPDFEAKKALHFTLLTISVVLTIFSILNIIICSKKLCCNNVVPQEETGVLQPSYTTYVMDSRDRKIEVQPEKRCQLETKTFSR